MAENKSVSKYEPLWNYLKDNGLDEYELTFQQIADICGFRLDHSFLTYKKQARAYGYEVRKISMKEEKVFIAKGQ